MLEKAYDMYLGIIMIIIIDFERGTQNMMGFSCMKAVYEHTSYLHGRKKYCCLTRNPATRKKKYYKEIA